MAKINNKIVLGISGTFASGKGTLAAYLAKHYNLLNVSTSDMLAAEAMREFGNTDRPSKHAAGERLRRAQGGGVLAQIALDKLVSDKTHDGIVVSDLRSLGEANVVKNAGGIIIFVDAPIELRYQRMTSRARDAETNITLADFKEREAREWCSGTTDADFNLGGIKTLADIQLTNDNTLDGLSSGALEQLRLYL
jgi:dephospho-CoA kinase